MLRKKKLSLKMLVNTSRDMLGLLTQQYGNKAFATETIYFCAFADQFTPAWARHAGFDFNRLNAELLKEQRPTWERFRIVEDAITGFACAIVGEEYIHTKKVYFRINVDDELKQKLMTNIVRLHQDFQEHFDLECKVMAVFANMYEDRYRNELVKVLYHQAAVQIKRKKLSDHERWDYLYHIARDQVKEWKQAREEAAQQAMDEKKLSKLRRDVRYSDLQNMN